MSCLSILQILKEFLLGFPKPNVYGMLVATNIINGFSSEIIIKNLNLKFTISTFTSYIAITIIIFSVDLDFFRYSEILLHLI